MAKKWQKGSQINQHIGFRVARCEVWIAVERLDRHWHGSLQLDTWRQMGSGWQWHERTATKCITKQNNAYDMNGPLIINLNLSYYYLERGKTHHTNDAY